MFICILIYEYIYHVHRYNDDYNFNLTPQGSKLTSLIQCMYLSSLAFRNWEKKATAQCTEGIYIWEFSAIYSK